MTSPPPRNSFNTSEQSSYGRLDSTPDLLAEEGDLGAWRRRKDKGKGRAQDVLPGAEDEEESFPPLQGDVEAQESKRIADVRPFSSPALPIPADPSRRLSPAGPPPKRRVANPSAAPRPSFYPPVQQP